ncbi:MAG TPA: MFS transporter, partial [Chloroflexi bacterium]|nr:MFS transporter [Chloroflexota bacterium]
ALYLFGRVPERGVSGPQRRAQRTDQEASLWRVLRGNDLFWRFVLISMGFNFFWQLGGPYFGVYQVEVLGATASVVGWLSMVSAAMRMIGQQVWGRAVDRRGARWALTLCHLLIPFLPFIWLPLRAPWQLVFVVVPSGFLWAGREIANFNLLLELVGEERQTDMIAGYNTLIAVANILGPLVGGQVIRLWGYRADFVLSGIGRMVAALLFLGLLRPFRGRVWTLLAPDRRGS